DDDDGDMDLSALRKAILAQGDDNTDSTAAAAEPLPDAISRDEILQVWEQVAEKLDGDALRFITLRNAMSAFVKSVFFKASPVNKMLAALADPGPPTAEDL